MPGKSRYKTKRGANADSFSNKNQLCGPHEDLPERRPKPATCTYDNGIERIPLCPEHYERMAPPGSGTWQGPQPCGAIFAIFTL